MSTVKMEAQIYKQLYAKRRLMFDSLYLYVCVVHHFMRISKITIVRKRMYKMSVLCIYLCEILKNVSPKRINNGLPVW